MRAALPYAALAARLLAGGMLLAAGFLKLRGPAEEFAAALEAYRLLPAALVFPAARVLPWIEYLLGIYLLAGLWLRRTVPAALVLFGLFVAALASAFARGIDLAGCGCFGAAWPISPAATLAADSLCVLLLSAAAFDREGLLSVDRRTATPARRAPGAKAA